MIRHFFKTGKKLVIGVVGGIFLLIAGTMWANAAPQETYEPEFPLGLDEDAFYVPNDNPMTKKKIELGRFLFFDKRLPKNDTIACATCHIPAPAFTDRQPGSPGNHGP